MAHKVLIGGTAYDTKGGRCLVNGTGYSIKKGRTLINGTGYDISFVNYDPVFANNDWATIISACQANAVPATWVVGSSKSMTINGASYQIDIIGKKFFSSISFFSYIFFIFSYSSLSISLFLKSSSIYSSSVLEFPNIISSSHSSFVP